jgi:hypothetical protein
MSTRQSRYEALKPMFIARLAWFERHGEPVGFRRAWAALQVGPAQARDCLDRAAAEGIFEISPGYQSIRLLIELPPEPPLPRY